VVTKRRVGRYPKEFRRMAVEWKHMESVIPMRQRSWAFTQV
jgi:hypothetical protein